MEMAEGTEEATAPGGECEEGPCLPVPKVEVPTRPHGHEIIVWTDKYRVLKQCAAVPQERGELD
jgi:hypothetical protein